MQRTLTRLGMAGTIAALTVASVLGSSLVAQADVLQDTIADNVEAALVLEPGSATGKTAGIQVLGNNSAGPDSDPGCNIDRDEAPLVLDIVAPNGVTANPSRVSLTACEVLYTVTFTASAAATSGTATVSIVSMPGGGGTFYNHVGIPIKIGSANTKPSVAVQGVTAGDYEIGSEPIPSCTVTDKEDGNKTVAAAVTGTLSHGLGTLTATCDHTDLGGLAADTKSVTYRIVDTGLPTISHELKGTGPNAAGWYRNSVLVDYLCSDNGSGIESCGPDVTLVEGENQSSTGTAVDWAGNSAQDGVADLDIDLTAPGITAALTPGTGPNANGWYNRSVDVDFSCTDDLSGVETCTGDTTVGEGVAGSATGSATDVAGNSATKTVSGLSIDATEPTAGYSLRSESTPRNGWYRTPVTVDFTCDDALSGIDTCVGDTELREGADQSAPVTATDKAGNVFTRTVSDIDVDLTAPGITAALTPGTGPNANGWYNRSVDVDFSCTDDLSGIETCTGDTTVGEGLAGSATGSATDVAGNSATRSVSGLDVDVTAPSVGYSLVSTSTPRNGWYNAPVTVDFTCLDALSGVATCSDDAQLGEGAGQSSTGTATDRAGNAGSSTASGIDVDLTAPTVGFAPGFGTSYHFGAVPTAPTCQASDELSGLEKCQVSGYGSDVGTHTLVATATDNAGNVRTASFTYQVLAWNLKGFTSPVDMNGTWNTVKGGSTVPFKFEIFRGATELTATTAIESFTAVTVACPNSLGTVDEIELVATGGTSLRYDATAGQFIQNLATPKKPGACVKVTMTALDHSVLTANLLLK
ncbi:MULTISPECIES: PxKF domain-containing protein [unclassified Agromyces]|uniref:PxKF domain-containing protein n=1 Tax=unclassified Agromyces TaxID=2639701 RepID=UPI003014CEF3